MGPSDDSGAGFSPWALALPPALGTAKSPSSGSSAMPGAPWLSPSQPNRRSQASRARGACGQGHSWPAPCSVSDGLSEPQFPFSLQSSEVITSPRPPEVLARSDRLTLRMARWLGEPQGTIPLTITRNRSSLAVSQTGTTGGGGEGPGRGRALHLSVSTASQPECRRELPSDEHPLNLDRAGVRPGPTACSVPGRTKPHDSPLCRLQCKAL